MGKKSKKEPSLKVPGKHHFGIPFDTLRAAEGSMTWEN